MTALNAKVPAGLAFQRTRKAPSASVVAAAISTQPSSGSRRWTLIVLPSQAAGDRSGEGHLAADQRPAARFQGHAARVGCVVRGRGVVVDGSVS